METETLEQMQARHRKELKELQGRITNKKKNASKKTRKGVNDECAEMELQMREKQAAEVAALDAGEEEEEEAKKQEDGGAEEEEEEGEPAQSLEQATAKLHICDDGDNDKQPGGGGGKKRNRQKERLARRAAEQEAASQRAEQEASTMTDHRAREGSYMRKTFQAHGLVEKDIEPDGHCLFSAVADQLRQNADDDEEEDELGYRAVRRAAAEYMAGHADDFAPFLDEDLGAYVAKVRDTAEWGGQLELTALARRYGVEIRVIQDGRTETIGEEEGKATGKTLWLAYYRHGYGLGEHYNSLRKAATTTTTTTAAAAATTG